MTAFVLTFVCVLLLIPAAVLFVEVAVAMMPVKARSLPPAGGTGRIVVLIPAHDEETTIARTLRSIAPQLRPGDRLLVVADNCADQTEQIARNEGAQAKTQLAVVGAAAAAGAHADRAGRCRDPRR